MRIGIDGLPLTEPLAGIGHYTWELARYLARNTDCDEIEVVSPRAFLQSIISEQRNNSHLRFTQKRVNPITGRWWSIGLPRHILRSQLEIFHGTNFEIPLQGICASVITIHDLSLLLYPETHERRRVWRARRRLPLMARRATMIITVSDAVRREIQEHLKIPPERIVTVHSAARERFRPMESQRARQIRSSLRIEDDFVLYAGTIEPRKNLSLLVRAFEQFSVTSKTAIQLVLAGREGWLAGELHKTLRQSAMRQNVVFTGYLNDEELCALYSTCKVFVYPSLYEGFGLPPLEAMACGAPVIASAIPSIKEVVSDAAFLVSPHSQTEVAQAMSDVLNNESLRQNLITAGKKRATEFSWALTAKDTRDVYAEAIDRFNHGQVAQRGS